MWDCSISCKTNWMTWLFLKNEMAEISVIEITFKLSGSGLSSGGGGGGLGAM
jgi:hypothetical protein